MVCRLCLVNSDESIDIFSKSKVKDYAWRFLQIKLSPDDAVSRVVCPSCWQELDNFQNFYVRIKNAQKLLPTMFEDLKTDVKIESFRDEPGDLEASLDSQTENSVTSESFLKEPVFELVEVFKEEIVEPTVEKTFLEEEQISCPGSLNITISKPKVDSVPPAKRIYRKRKAKIDYSEPEFKDIKMRRKYLRRKPDPRNPDNAPTERTRKLLQKSQEFDQIIKDHNFEMVCDICGVNLEDFAEVKLHFRRSHNTKGYVVCCKKRMHKRHLLVDHLTSHTGGPHICTVCGKESASKDALSSHIKYMHLTEHDFQCTFCDRAFRNPLALKEHTAKHTGEALYTCPHCPKKYFCRASLHGHRKDKHRAEWEASKR